MIPHLLFCQLGIGLLVFIIAIGGLSELFRMFSIGLGIIIGGATLIGKTHCKQLTAFHTINMK
jgi:hypothetical protein